MPPEFINPPTLSKTYGWTQVVKHGPGTLVHISGQASLDKDGNVIAKGDLKRQTEQTFENLKLALAAAGATWNDVIVTRLYVVGFRPEHLPIIREVRSRYVSPTHPPASTLVGVTALAVADWLIEIEATALLE